MNIENINCCEIMDFMLLDYFKPIDKFNGMIIVPINKLHDSGYRCMKFVLTNHSRIVGCVGGGSDVIHLNGIGGYGQDYENALITEMVKRVDWSIDCLPCGLLRLFSSFNLGIDDIICSDFNLWAIHKENRT